ncbi:DUF6178 family protein [Thermodesulforhabdus norvegica]|uniref:Uncharacterized protein n=1 Tax=Thermodesulforhabdus norvegica TaxID=39841 RepID=A0A1I4U934_9BACT|nr:DUF6178 family protein [Thermodesulforhabdus norvegica]SFM85330.1 hypothetical protein SAMN05660836_01709 [Thermodesulforhabdus norvegica]
MGNQIIDFSEEKIKRLPAAEYAQVVMRLPAKRRMEAILDRADAVAVVRSMPLQDFYMTVMEVGPDDALPLLSLASTEQWIHIFDMECWNKDRIVPGEGIAWLDRLARAGYEPLVQWLYNVEFFFLISMIKQWIRVVIRPDDIDLTEALDYLPPHTIDDQYFWECRYPQYEDLIRHVLSILFETNYGYYKEIMEHAVYGLDAEMEEEAYRFHKGRLEDQAIPDYYDALTIYVPMEPSEVARTKMRYLAAEPVMSPPSFAVVKLEESEDLFSRALGRIENKAVLEYIQLELAALANKVIIADRVRFQDSELLRECLDKVRATLNLGLHILSRPGVNPSSAAQILMNVYLEHIFRVGLEPLKKLGRRARRLVEHGWIARCPLGMNILEPEWYEFVDLLCQPFPQLQRHVPGRAPFPDFFRRPSEVSEAQERLDTVLCMGIILDSIEVPWQELTENLWREGHYASIEDVTVSVLLFTAAAHSLVHEKPRFTARPIPVADWEKIFPLLHPDALIPHIRTWLSINVQGEQWQKHVNSYIQSIINAYLEEMGPFYRRGETPDPRWVKFFLFTQ